MIPTPNAAAPAREAAPDDAYRRYAVEVLSLQLTRGSALLAHCEAIAKAEFTEVRPILAAARLISANAQIAKVLAQMARVEQRSRTIIETYQRPDPEIAGLNSILNLQQMSSAEHREKIRNALERGLLQFLEERKQDRERREGVAIGSCI